MHSDGKTVHNFDKFKNSVDFTSNIFGGNRLEGAEIEQNEMSVETAKLNNYSPESNAKIRSR